MLTCLVPVLFTFHIQNVLKLKKNNFGAKGLRVMGFLSRCYLSFYAVCGILVADKSTALLTTCRHGVLSQMNWRIISTAAVIWDFATYFESWRTLHSTAVSKKLTEILRNFRDECRGSTFQYATTLLPNLLPTYPWLRSSHIWSV